MDLLNKKYSEYLLHTYAKDFSSADWYIISKTQNLSSEFIETHISKFSKSAWSSISTNQNLTFRFFIKYHKYINLYTLMLSNTKITKYKKILFLMYWLLFINKTK